MYKTITDITNEFKKDFKELLEKYDAVMEIDEDPGRYAYTPGEPYIKVHIPAKYDKNNWPESPYAEMNFYAYIDKDSI